MEGRFYLDGDKDIACAILVVNDRWHGLGEWDGEKGYINP
jgi:hypothetical protein